MAGLLRDLFWKLGKRLEEQEIAKKSTYKPKYGGQWIDKSKTRDEDWQWVEPKKAKGRTHYINIFQLEDDYVLTVGYSPRPNALETLECEDKEEMEIKLRYAKVAYEILGTVVISNETE